MPGLSPGTLLADTYRIVRLVGVGGMGEVYEATHDRLAGRYAVKVLLAEIMTRTDLFQRFRREAEVTSSLRHPNIVQVLDFNVTPDGHPYLVMEYLDGVELAAAIARGGPMPPNRIVDIVGQIASALTAAHSRKIVHRDLKPQNLFLLHLPGENREIVKVVDFGISKMREATTHLTCESAVMGTPQYMAPEQAEGKVSQLDERTDEFALAAITYELFSGRRAFDGESAPSILYQVVHRQPDPLSQVAPRVGPQVEAVIRKALSKSPDDRYPSALDFHRELAGAVAAEQSGVTADLSAQPSRQPSSPTALDKPPTALDNPTTLGLAAAPLESAPARTGVGRRRRLWAGLAGALVLAGATVAAYQWLGTGRTRSTASSSESDSGKSAASLATNDPSGKNSTAVRAVKPSDVTRIEVVYSTEKKGWIEAVTADFHRRHPDIQVELVGKASIESAREILDGRLEPTVWSPSDSMVLKMLYADWQAKHREKPLFSTGDDRTQPLLLTPLVFVVWENRADVLKKAGSGTVTWKDIRKGLTSAKGWAALGGAAQWGRVKLGHTDPTQSNSGLQALYLMLLDHTEKPRIDSRDLQNRKNLDFVRDMETGRVRLDSSTGLFMTDMVRFGPSKYDIAVVYESSAITEMGHAEGRWGKLKVCYPAKTMWSDNPAVVLTAPWVGNAQARAANTYLAFLHSRPAQEQALAFGFRPANTSIKILTKDPQNPFVQFADHGIDVSLPPAVDMPDGQVVRGLMAMWTRARQSDGLRRQRRVR